MVGRMKHQDSIAMGLLLLCGLLVRQASCEEPTITIFSPIDGAVITGGAVYLNYSISHCPSGSFIAAYVDDAEVEGNAKPCMPIGWYGISYLPEGEHTARVVLLQDETLVAIAHSSVHFEVVAGHGRLFLPSPTVFADALPTMAFFSHPPNRTAVAWQSDGIVFELTAMNFIPGRHGLSFRVAESFSGLESFVTDSHNISLLLPQGTHCLDVEVVNSEEQRVGGWRDEQGEEEREVERLCVRVVDPKIHAHAPPCETIETMMSDVTVTFGLVLDLPGCELAKLVAAKCKTCRKVICADQDFVPSPPNLSATRQDYKEAALAPFGRVTMQQVPFLEEETFDFVLLHHSRVESSVDQQAELTSFLSVCWRLVKPGGVLGVLHEPRQTIITIDLDGNLEERFAEYPQTIEGIAHSEGEVSSQARTCELTGWTRSRLSFTVKPPAPAPPRVSAEPSEGEGDAGGSTIAGIGHIYIIHYEPLKERRRYLEDVFFKQWKLNSDYVTFVTWCDSRKTGRDVIDRYYRANNSCLRRRLVSSSSQLLETIQDGGDPVETSDRVLGFQLKSAQLCAAISHYESLVDMLEQGYETALILEDDAVFDLQLPSRLPSYMKKLDPDWGVLFTDAATSCHWWIRCEDLPHPRPIPTVFKRYIPGGAFGGAILWHQRAARALTSTFLPFCAPWDMEIEFHFQVHNISVFFASPSLIVQGSFLNPGELGFTPSSLLGERSGETVAPVADGVCDTFSFFDCHAEKEWDECVALRERCRGEN
mmetsp:Transcript_927/g.2915  ORF Transcript_927/g.2915 Transcript_927/m.2915 type:complete len:763 (-) Transcript_927:1116-3404(-)